MYMKEKRTERLNLRATADEVELIDRASAEAGTDRTTFLLDAAAREAEWLLAERISFELNSKDWNQFTKLLDRPARELPRLRKLMLTPTILEVGR